MSNVNHPAHYGGGDNPYEAIKVIEAWGLGFCAGNAVKYILRAGKKEGSSLVEDLRKAEWYLLRAANNPRELRGSVRPGFLPAHLVAKHHQTQSGLYLALIEIYNGDCAQAAEYLKLMLIELAERAPHP